MADVTSTSTPAPDAPAVTTERPAAPQPVEVDVLDDLVEDVSIDGMCGVY
jgi:mycofactocin precursor